MTSNHTPCPHQLEEDAPETGQIWCHNNENNNNTPPPALHNAGGQEAELKQGLEEAGGHDNQVGDGVSRAQRPGKQAQHAVGEDHHQEPEHQPLRQAGLWKLHAQHLL